MTCHDARASLSAFLDEALAPDERREVEAHLEGCAECQRELDRLQQTVALLHRVEPARAPVGFVDRVAAAARPRPWYRRAVAAVFLPLSVKLPVEVTALVMVALLAVYVFERTPTLQQAAREEASRPERPSVQLADKLERPAPPGRRFASPAPAPTPRGEDRRDASTSQDARAPAPAAAPPPVAAPPPAAKEAPSDRKVEGVPGPEAENRQKAAEQAARSLGTPPAAPRLAAKRAQPPADVIAGASVKDRDAAERDLAQVIARGGGRQTQRRQEGATTIVEALIPQARYAEFSESLARIGPWQVQAERPDLPAQLRVILRLR
ncbi:MAG TPA: zf-HC2 domain-containing protein [Methylomirabilota bacterium]